MIDRAAIIIDGLFGGRLFSKAEDLGDLRRSGRGIIDRYDRFNNAWQPHLDSCRLVQREWAKGLAASARERLLVLGAGRLLDFETRLLPCQIKSAEDFSFKHVSLIDGDSGCLPTWENFQQELGQRCLAFEIMELTGRIAAWEQALSKRLSCLGRRKLETKWQAALREVREIAALSPEDVSSVTARLGLRSPTSILSLNILSQLPLAWQRIVERNLYREFGARFTDSREEEWILAYRLGAEKILGEHLSLLCSLKPESMLIITDIEYIHPKNAGSVESLESLRWRLNSAESDLPSILIAGSGEYYFLPDTSAPPLVVIDALAGSGITEPTGIETHLKGYYIDRAKSWLWHIVPRRGTSESRSEVHRIAAFSLKRRDCSPQQ